MRARHGVGGAFELATSVCAPRSGVPARLATAVLGAVSLLGSVFLASCATTDRPQQFRAFLLPPAPVVTPAELPSDAPDTVAALYPNEVPSLPVPIAVLPRPSDTDFLIKRADDRFAAGKKAFEESRFADARREFDSAMEILLTAPDNLTDRARLEQHTEEMVEAIYRYDVDQLGAGESADHVVYDQSPLDSILEMTFPVDPSLRNKVKEQIQATASQLPLEESDAVISYINFFSSDRGKKILAGGLRRSGRYKALIERVLAEEGLPQELIFVAQAESGFLPRAMSNKRCVGLWQFAQFRGREYGLTQTLLTDDRMDPEKATRAAARHLHDLYIHFGDWNLALAAYDCGPGCVDHAVMRTGYADFWTLRRLNVLPKETANYVPVILAMTIMSKNAKDYGLDGLEFDPPVVYDTIELQTPTSLALAADAVDRPIGTLRDLNPALLSAVAPAGYALRLPKGTLDAVEASFRVVPSNRRDAWRLHRMESGETLASLAKRYGTQTSALMAANHDESPEPGTLVAIPVPYSNEHRVRSTSTHASSAAASSKTNARNRTAHRTTSQTAAAAHTTSHVTPAKGATQPATAQHKTVPQKTAALAPKSSSTRTAHPTAPARTPNS